MDPILLVFTICLYLISLVISLLLGMTAKRFPGEKIRLPAAFHFIFLFLALGFLFILEKAQIGNYLLLLSVCSGTALAGWSLRNEWIRKPLRIYLASWLLLIPVFLWSPSRIFYAISGNYRQFRPEQQFNLQSNYYLVEQQSMLQEQKATRYKVIRKFGIYNKTLARDVDFGARLQSVQLIQLSDDTLIMEGKRADSSIQRIGLKPGMKKNTITRKPSA